MLVKSPSLIVLEMNCRVYPQTNEAVEVRHMAAWGGRVKPKSSSCPFSDSQRCYLLSVVHWEWNSDCKMKANKSMVQSLLHHQATKSENWVLLPGFCVKSCGGRFLGTVTSQSGLSLAIKPPFIQECECLNSPEGQTTGQFKIWWNTGLVTEKWIQAIALGLFLSG